MNSPLDPEEQQLLHRCHVNNILAGVSVDFPARCPSLPGLLLEIDQPQDSAVMNGRSLPSPFVDLCRHSAVFGMEPDLLPIMPQLIRNLGESGVVHNILDERGEHWFTLLCNSPGMSKYATRMEDKELLLQGMRQSHSHYAMNDMAYHVIDHFSGSGKLDFINKWLDNIPSINVMTGGPWFSSFSKDAPLTKHILQEISDQGRDILAPCPMSTSHIRWSIFQEHFQGANEKALQCTALAYAFSQADTELVKSLLVHGADPHAPQMFIGEEKIKSLNLFEFMKFYDSSANWTAVTDDVSTFILSMERSVQAQDLISELFPKISKTGVKP